MSKSLYFIIYRARGRKSELSLRVSTLDSKDFIRLGGVRANRLLRSIASVLDAYALKYDIIKRGNEVIMELPADVGYAVLVYLLLVYSAKKPEKYAFFLEKLLSGSIPLSKYFNVFIDMAIDLSDLKRVSKRKRTVVEDVAAKTVSSMMRILIKNIA